MKRCPDSAGKWELRFQWLDHRTRPDHPGTRAHVAAHLPIRMLNDDGRPVTLNGIEQYEEDVPRPSARAPYIGELCAHEVEWCRSLPGLRYNRHWRFELIPLDGQTLGEDDEEAAAPRIKRRQVRKG